MQFELATQAFCQSKGTKTEKKAGFSITKTKYDNDNLFI